MERNRNRGSGAKWRMHSMVERMVERMGERVGKMVVNWWM